MPTRSPACMTGMRRASSAWPTLVFAALFFLLERRGEEEDRFPVLDRGHAPHRKTAAIAGAIDRVDDRMLDVAGPQEVRMQ